MKSLSKILITLYFVCISFEAFSSSDDIYLGLTDSQHFRTYPYVDKAFRDENDKQYNEALEEMQRALVIVPNHAPYIKYTYTLSLLAGRPDSELIALVERLPQPDSGNLLLEIRIKESKSGKLYTPHEVDVMTSGLSKTQSQTWYENHLYQIEKVRGRQSALNWALNQQTKYKNLGAQRYEAYALSGSNKYPEALSILKNIKKNNQENDKDLEYLASLYLALEQDQEALVIVKDIPSKQGKQKIYASYIASLLDASRLSEARSELNRLYKSNILTAEMKNQRDYLNSLSSTQLNHFEVEGPNIDSCLNKVIDLTLSNLIKEAKINFSHCSPKNTPYTWLTVAEQLQAYSELRSTKFQTPLYENKRRDILISYYSNTQKWLEITELLDNNRLLSRHTRTLAYAYSHLGDYLRSSDLMFTLYQKEHVLSDVDFATYTRLNLPNRKIETAEMLNESFSYSSSEFLTSHNLVQRVAILANEDVSLFPVQTIETLNTKLRLESKIPASSWQNQKKCDDLSQDISPRHDYKKQAEAYCISAQDTRAAADLYVETLTPSSSEAERIIIAKWYAIASQYSKSYQYWSDVELSNLDNYSRYLYITTLNEMEYTQQADSLWRKTNFNKQNDQWWLLGFKIADNLDNKELAYQRLEKGFSVSHSSDIVRKIGLHYQESGQTEKLNALVNEVLVTDRTGDSSSELGYVLLNKNTEQAETLLSHAYTYSKYHSDPILLSEYARVSGLNGNEVKAKLLYETAIDEVYSARSMTEQKQTLLKYLQQAHRDIDLGWKFTVAGWIGESRVQTVPGFSSTDGNFFLYEEGLYTFEDPWVPRSAISISSLQSGLTDSPDDFGAEADLAYQVQPLSFHNTYFKLGIKQSINGNDYTRPYLRVSSDIFSNDNWSKGWKDNRSHWFYQNLYLDALVYLTSNDKYSLYGRYEAGETFKTFDNNLQRITPYAFTQWSSSELEDYNQTDLLAGIGLSWSWEWYKTHYDGFKVNSEVGLEWQHVLDSDNVSDSDDSILLRFSSYF